jgi:hypothetical protein
MLSKARYLKSDIAIGLMAKNGISDSEIMKRINIDPETLKMFKTVREKALKEAKGLGKKKAGKIKVLGISGSARDEFDMAQERPTPRSF